MSTTSPHFAKNVFFGCIDDRLSEAHLKFIIKVGDAFCANVAGGGLAFVNDAERATALKQVVAAYTINQIDTVYLESHTGCGAYALSGAVFTSGTQELNRLYQDLDQAAELLQKALTEAGAKSNAVTIHVNVVDPAGSVQARPEHAAATT